MQLEVQLQPTCSDTGTAFQTNEYYTIGNSSGGRNNQLELICASSAYARGATGDGITIAVVDTGGPSQVLQEMK